MRRLWVAFALVLPVLSMTACMGGGGKELTVTARFADIGDLADHAPVMLADVKIGEVTGIKLSNDEALVTMRIEKSADVPQKVTARVRRTSLLGERIVDLVPAAGLPSNAPLLADGQTIKRTEIRADLEDLVQAGNAVLQPITASEISTLIDEGYKGFGGRGEDVKTLLDNLQQIVHAYSQHTAEITSVIDSLNQFNSTIAQDADAQGQSVQNTARALDMLDQESGQLQKTLHDLVRLSTGGRAILDQHVDEMEAFFAQARTILGVLQQNEASIETILARAPHHDFNTQVVEYQQFNQIFQDFVICGLNDDPKNPARTCTPSTTQGAKR